jgi:hypothetical protein
VYLLNENLNNQDSSFYFLTIYTLLLLLLESCAGDPGKIPLIHFVLPAASDREERNFWWCALGDEALKIQIHACSMNMASGFGFCTVPKYIKAVLNCVDKNCYLRELKKFNWLHLIYAE